MTPQRAHQLKQLAAGKCEMCQSPCVNKTRCEFHREQARMAAERRRKRQREAA